MNDADLTDTSRKDHAELAHADTLIDAANEVRIRQELALVALGKRPADPALRVGRLSRCPHAHLARGLGDRHQGRRIAWVGPAGHYHGRSHGAPSTNPRWRPCRASAKSTSTSRVRISRPNGRRRSSLPRGNTWTCEASHEFSNVDGPHNLDFWLDARRRGSPLKIFPLPGLGGAADRL